MAFRSRCKRVGERSERKEHERGRKKNHKE